MDVELFRLVFFHVARLFRTQSVVERGSPARASEVGRRFPQRAANVERQTQLENSPANPDRHAPARWGQRCPTCPGASGTFERLSEYFVN
jgi:hypothetical protein